MWLDAQLATLKTLSVQMISGKTVAADMVSLLPSETEALVRKDEELMFLGEGIAGGIRIEPDS